MKFSIGEIAWALSDREDKPTRTECEILRLLPDRYIISVPGFPSGRADGRWLIDEAHLRKKKPPEEDIDWVEKLGLKAPKQKTKPKKVPVFIEK